MSNMETSVKWSDSHVCTVECQAGRKAGKRNYMRRIFVEFEFVVIICCVMLEWSHLMED